MYSNSNTNLYCLWGNRNAHGDPDFGRRNKCDPQIPNDPHSSCPKLAQAPLT